jgi:large subunit ribosomal protein L21
MFAIVSIAGQQFKVQQSQYLYVHRLPQLEGAAVEFADVMLVSGETGTRIGAPVLAGAKVSATVLGHLRGDKVWVFKKKRRKGYQKMNGHRQALTKIRIDGIVA